MFQELQGFTMVINEYQKRLLILGLKIHFLLMHP